MAYTLYKHIAPNGRVYIGITSQAPKRRWQGGTGYKNNSYFCRAIKKYGWDSFTHEIIAENLTQDEAKQKEIEYIALYKSNIRKYGYNISSGGESKKGTTISDWHKRQISKASKNRVVSDDTRKKLSVSSKETWNNQEFRQYMRRINTGQNNSQYGKIRTDEEKIKRGAQSIVQYDLNNNVIGEYISIHKASEVTGVSRDCISKCCRNIFKQASGYIWKYKDDL